MILLIAFTNCDSDFDFPDVLVVRVSSKTAQTITEVARAGKELREAVSAVAAIDMDWPSFDAPCLDELDLPQEFAAEVKKKGFCVLPEETEAVAAAPKRLRHIGLHISLFSAHTPELQWVGRFGRATLLTRRVPIEEVCAWGDSDRGSK